MTVTAGHSILTKSHEENVIRIAFTPLAETEIGRLAVRPRPSDQQGAIAGSSEFFKPDFPQIEFLRRYPEDNPEADDALVKKSITRRTDKKTAGLAPSCPHPTSMK